MGSMNIRNNIARIGATALIGCGLVATSVPATFAVEGAPQVVHTYADSAQFIAPDVWVEGQGLNIGGEGFKTADGTSGSVLALKLNKGAVKIDGQDYLEIHADSDGNFSLTIPWQAELHGSVSVDIYLLSGSLKDGDVPRGGKAATVTIKVAEQPAPAPSEEPTPAPSEDPTPAPSEAPTPAPTEDPTPAPTENPTPTPSEDSTPAPTQDPTTEAPKPADETSAPAVEDAKETKPAEDQKPAEEQKSDEQSAPAADHVEGDSKGSNGSKDSDNVVLGSSGNDNLGSGSNGGLSSGSNDNLGSGSSNASSKSSSSLAKTGASDAMTATGLGLIALGAGVATIVATRMRKKA